jgi:orotidine-5'-phosphate decarboxylase
MDDGELDSIGVHHPAEQQVPLLAQLAMTAGADGVVCSPREAARLRGVLGERALIVTPGVRPAGSEMGDQSRVATPSSALKAGASHLVVGRPITSAPVPAIAARQIIREMEDGQ